MASLEITEQSWDDSVGVLQLNFTGLDAIPHTTDNHMYIKLQYVDNREGFEGSTFNINRSSNQGAQWFVSGPPNSGGNTTQSVRLIDALNADTLTLTLTVNVATIKAVLQGDVGNEFRINVMEIDNVSGDPSTFITQDHTFGGEVGGESGGGGDPFLCPLLF